MLAAKNLPPDCVSAIKYSRICKIKTMDNLIISLLPTHVIAGESWKRN